MAKKRDRIKLLKARLSSPTKYAPDVTAKMQKELDELTTRKGRKK